MAPRHWSHCSNSKFRFYWPLNLVDVFDLQVTKLQSDISPLHHSLSVLSEKNGLLQADKRILEDDVKRLKARAQVCDYINSIALKHVL